MPYYCAMNAYKILIGSFKSYSDTTKFKKKNHAFSNSPVMSYNGGYALEVFSTFKKEAAEQTADKLEKTFVNMIVRSWV